MPFEVFTLAYCEMMGILYFYVAQSTPPSCNTAIWIITACDNNK